MANNLRKFNTEAEYSATSLNYPSVSWVLSSDTVHFDKRDPNALLGDVRRIYNLTYSDEVRLYNTDEMSGVNASIPTHIWVDGEEIPPISSYRLGSLGVHNVDFEYSGNTVPIKAFRGIGEVVEVIIDSGVTSIGHEAFYQNYNLSAVTIPDSVTSIGSKAFGNCPFSSITIPSGVTSIGHEAFKSCINLTSVTCLATTPPTLDYSTFDETSEDLVIYVPASSVSTYQSYWSDYADKITAIQ